LIIVGNGINNRSAGDVIVEGTGVDAGNTPGTNYAVNYTKGTSNDDSSGELKYVRVEFAGYAPRVNEEFNAFTFAAVGKNTKVSFLEALAGLDDSYEFFGGAVDADHLVSYETPFNQRNWRSVMAPALRPPTRKGSRTTAATAPSARTPSTRPHSRFRSLRTLR
jgi:hypothetical protein